MVDFKLPLNCRRCRCVYEIEIGAEYKVPVAWLATEGGSARRDGRYMIYERLLLLRCEQLLLNSSLAPNLPAMGTMPSSRDRSVNSFTIGDRSTGSELHVVAHNSLRDG